ncbi:MAG: circularly permuted type 2 ATP-grasp protein, partial [Polaromonas sp.]|nr:circularly permuted type 2 ATP-grasp protein [Polaromonas sp.]
MANNNNSLFTELALEGPTEFASALAPAAAAGHFDEVRGSVSSRLHSPVDLPGQLQSQSQSQSQSQGTSAALPTMGPLAPLIGATPLFSVTPSQPPVAKIPTGARDTADAAPLSTTWTTFFNFLGTDGFYDLNRRSANLQRQIRDNGVTYNVYADADGPQRPWSLDLFPMIVSEQDWAKIEVGVAQRAKLLNGIMADIYGPQTLLANGLLPSALVHGHAGYLRAMNGYRPPGGTYLHIAAFDIAHGPGGQWSVVSQRTQAPSGLGYLLENRLTISLLFPEAFRDMKVQRLAATYRALIDGMRAASPVADSRVVLLTSGPYNETYFEHAYLARYLGLTLVEGSDLMVRNDRLFLKTLKGLEPVHGLLKRLDDEFLDPLELRSDSTLGVPGLLQVIRAGHVMVVNTPGSAFLESSALLGFLPALSRHLLGETLALPSQATWWCGERAVMRDALSQLKHCVIKPTYPGTGVASVLGHTLNQRELDEWAGRILRRGEDFTVQAYQPLSQTPTWHGQRLEPRSAMLRVFAVADGTGAWQVLPGGLARLAGKNENIASMQHGGSSADVWVVGRDADRRAAETSIAPAPLVADPTTIKPAQAAASPALQRRPVTSRAAENLFWLGRYTERAENAVRLSRLTLQCLGGENQNSPPLLAWLTRMAVGNMLVLGTVPPATQARRVFERALIANLADTTQAASVGYNLSAVKSAAAAVRERLSQDQWQMIVRTESDFFEQSDNFGLPAVLKTPAKDHNHGRRVTDPESDHDLQAALEHPVEYSSVEALKTLESVSRHLAAVTGAQTDRMTRDDGWRLLSAGRLIERLQM